LSALTPPILTPPIFLSPPLLQREATWLERRLTLNMARQAEKKARQTWRADLQARCAGLRMIH